MEQFSWSVLIGGIAFFLYGLRSARNGLEILAGNRLRAILGRGAGHRLTALGFGAFVAFILQSSGEASAMLVSFANTGLVTLFQATGVLLGADIGTSFVVILLSIKKIADVALSIVIAGFCLRAIGRKRKARHVGSIILGFGFVFFGIHLMTLASAPLKESETAINVFAQLAGHPIAVLISASLVAAVIHSAGAIGIAIALSFAGLITLETAIPIVLGANIGSCVTAMFASLRGGIAGKRVAFAHTLIKVAGVAAIFPFLSELANLVNGADNLMHYWVADFSTGVAAKIALTHIIFNAALAVLFVPMLKPLVKFVEIMLPLPIVKEQVFAPKYLDKKALETPTIAFAQSKQEIMRLASIAQNMFRDCLKMFSRGEDHVEAVEAIQSEDDKIDLLEKAIRFYLADVATENLSADQVKTQMALFGIAHELEEIGDTISRELTQLAIKKAKWHRLFSDDGWKDLRNFQRMIDQNFELMMSALIQPHEEIVIKITRREESMNEVEQQFRQAHIARLHQGLKETFDTSSIHLDILANFRRISTNIANITKLALEIG